MDRDRSLRRRENAENVGVTPIHTLCWFLIMFCFPCVLLVSCANGSAAPSKQTAKNVPLTTHTGALSITYDTEPRAVLIRTSYGGGNLGTLEFSPEISIYGDGSYILGPGLHMRQGKLSTDALQKLLGMLVDTDGLLNFSRQQFYDVPDQNATFLLVTLNRKQYAFVYGPFGNAQESTQDLDEYHRLGNALTSIREALAGPTHPYSSSAMTLLVHQDFSPDLSQPVAYWSYQGFSLSQAATYECGTTPPDETGPNADSGCLTFTAPHKALLLTPAELQAISPLLNAQHQGVFQEQGLYYSVVLRPLLPDELSTRTLAMLGSSESSYNGVPLQEGPMPTTTP
jgi:hypothetical protein